jgi:hypothetical protein
MRASVPLQFWSSKNDKYEAREAKLVMQVGIDVPTGET